MSKYRRQAGAVGAAILAALFTLYKLRGPLFSLASFAVKFEFDPEYGNNRQLVESAIAYKNKGKTFDIEYALSAIKKDRGKSVSRGAVSGAWDVLRGTRYENTIRGLMDKAIFPRGEAAERRRRQQLAKPIPDVPEKEEEEEFVGLSWKKGV